MYKYNADVPEFQYGYDTAVNGSVNSIKRFEVNPHKVTTRFPNENQGSRQKVFSVTARQRRHFLRQFWSINRTMIHDYIAIDLTYADSNMPTDPAVTKNHLNQMTKWLYKEYGAFLCWRMENQIKRSKKYFDGRRYCYHYHIMLFSPNANMMDIAGKGEKKSKEQLRIAKKWKDITSGDVKHYRAGTSVFRPTSMEQVFYYISKYIAKEHIDDKELEEGHYGRRMGWCNRKLMKKAITITGGVMSEYVFKNVHRTINKHHRKLIAKKIGKGIRAIRKPRNPYGYKLYSYITHDDFQHLIEYWVKDEYKMIYGGMLDKFGKRIPLNPRRLHPLTAV